jgi:hypothetical protein
VAVMPLLRGLGGPGLSERGELELVSRRAPILIREEEDCLSEDTANLDSFV